MKWLACVIVALILPHAPARAESSLVLLPAEFTLSTPESSQRLLVQRTSGSEVARQVREGIEWVSSRPDVATVANGVVRPVGDGEAVITARVGGQAATAKVRVTGMKKPFAWSFRNHVEPVLARLGCNAGACHEALAGKGGFRLSLRGYDPATDYFNMVKADRGRRVEFADPGRSLILAKPSGAIPHKGGVRYPADSRDYRIVAEWVSAGAPPPAESDPRVTALEVLPAGSLHGVGETQQIVVRARYSDGRAEDVTPWTKWASADESVCRVDENGAATVVGPGEGAVVAWYASRIAIARITVPYPDPKTSEEVGSAVDRRTPRNFIDEQIDRQLARLNLPASRGCDDASFLRRATVDTIGRLPTADEVRDFLADSSAGKRDALIDRLLARPEFVDYWTYKWCDLLTLTSTRLMPEALKTYYKWVRGEVAAGTPWDQFVRKILLATGDSLDNGATNFYALSQSPEDMTENACQAFLGLSIGCAKCHNHPLEKWSNDQYYAMANLFARVRAKGWGGEGGGGDGRRHALRGAVGRPDPAPDRQAAAADAP